MEKIVILNSKGEQISEHILDKNVWDKKEISSINYSLAYRYYLNNKRQGTKKTKSKGEVRGGGRKPWRQKGTGRARQGSIRSPQFRGGGTVFGPTGKENYSLSINEKNKKSVLISFLKEMFSQEKVFVLNEFKLENFKTKEAENFLKKLPFSIVGKSVLLVFSDKDEQKNFFIRAFRNIPYVKITNSSSLNFLHCFTSRKILFTTDSFNLFSERFS